MKSVTLGRPVTSGYRESFKRSTRTPNLLRSEALRTASTNIVRANVFICNDRRDLQAGNRRNVDEMTRSGRAKDWQRGRDAMKHAPDVNVDHTVPFIDLHFIQ